MPVSEAFAHFTRVLRSTLLGKKRVKDFLENAIKLA